MYFLLLSLSSTEHWDQSALHCHLLKISLPHRNHRSGISQLVAHLTAHLFTFSHRLSCAVTGWQGGTTSCTGLEVEQHEHSANSFEQSCKVSVVSVAFERHPFVSSLCFVSPAAVFIVFSSFCCVPSHSALFFWDGTKMYFFWFLCYKNKTSLSYLEILIHHLHLFSLLLALLKAAPEALPHLNIS